MKYLHHILTVNRPDLLQKAVASAEPIWENTSIIDNSPNGRIGKSLEWPVQIVRPSVPLDFNQSMNFMCRRAVEQGCDIFGLQHEDAEIQPGTALGLINFVEQLIKDKRRWCAANAHGMVYSMFYVPAFLDIGDWDVAFPNRIYHSDQDWAYRAKLKGYELIESHLPTIHMEGGSTTHKERGLKLVHDITFPMNIEYYIAKWGGLSGNERFTTPFNV